MTAEELWEKKEMVGITLIIMIFLSGVAVFKYSKRGGESAIGTLTQIRNVGNVTKAYDVTVTQKDALLFKERITTPTGPLKKIAEKNPGESFNVTFETLQGGTSIITSVGKTVVIQPKKP